MQSFFSHVSAQLLSEAQLANDWLANRHWGEAGRYMEGVLKRFLDSYLPQRFACGTGFVSDGSRVSKQCDLVIYDCMECPLLFRSNEFVVADKSAVRAVVQIKGTMKRDELPDAVANIQSVKAIGGDIFGAIFSYAGAARKAKTLASWFEPVLAKPQVQPDYYHFGGGTQLRYSRETLKLRYRFFTRDGGGAALADFWRWMLQACDPKEEYPAIQNVIAYLPLFDDWEDLN
jgi:hypothetical protein